MLSALPLLLCSQEPAAVLHELHSELIDDLSAQATLIMDELRSFVRDQFDSGERPPSLRRDIVQQTLAQIDLPLPTRVLDSGMNGVVFETTDKWVVLKITPPGFWEDSGEEEAVSGEYASGYVQVFDWRVVEGYLMVWKEWVDPDVEGFLYRKFPDKETRDAVAMGLFALNPYSSSSTADFNKLLRHEATAGLAQAILDGMRSDDLSLHDNLGVTRDEHIVAFDL